jgi:hypothetical protein
MRIILAIMLGFVVLAVLGFIGFWIIIYLMVHHKLGA